MPKAHPHLDLVAAPSAFPQQQRLEGGEIEDHFGPVCPWARLPDAAYWVRVRGWVLRPFRYVERAPLKNATERERDWRFILHTEVVGVEEIDRGAAAARSALFQHALHHNDRPRLPHGFRVAVGKDSGRWRVPRGGTLWELLAATGQRTGRLTMAAADALVGWHLLVRVHTPARHAARKPGIPGPRIPEQLQYSWGLEVEAVRRPHAQESQA
jgi:hypothetical protein